MVFPWWLSSDPANQCDSQVSSSFHSFISSDSPYLSHILPHKAYMENAYDLKSRKRPRVSPIWETVNSESNSVTLLPLVVAVFLAIQQGWLRFAP